MPMMSYTFSELLERADNVSGIYSLVTHAKSSAQVWGMGRKCAQALMELAAPEAASPLAQSSTCGCTLPAQCCVVVKTGLWESFGSLKFYS